MRIKLKKLAIKNFKGIDKLEFAFNGNAKVKGKNASGKTALYDAYLWLLYGKDSLDQKDFDIKPIVNGEPMHEAEHKVQAVLEIDGKDVTLERQYKEKYKKTADGKELDGHTTVFVINGAKVAQNKYSEYINGLCDETMFKLLSNPLHFNVNLKWNERRALLDRLTGGITNDAIAGNDKYFKGLVKKLDETGLTIDVYKDTIKRRQREINKELDGCPGRIQSLQSVLPEKQDTDTAITKSKISVIESQINDLLSAPADDGTKQLRAEIAELTDKVYKRTSELSEERAKKIDDARRAVRDLQNKKMASESVIRLNTDTLASLKNLYDEQFTTEKALREEYFLVVKEEFAPGPCPVCGREYPEEQLEEMRIAFDSNKKDRIDNLLSKGKSAKSARIEAETRIEKTEQKIAAEKAELAETTAKLESAETVYDAATKQSEPDTQIEQWNSEIAEKQSKLSEVKPDTSRIEEIGKLQTELDGYKKALALKDQYDSVSKQIEDIKAREKELSEEYKLTEKQLAIIDKFNAKRIAEIEKAMSDKFKLVKFKMYDEKQNGSTAETCESLYNGVPYRSWNNAARINGGLDIINAFASVFDIHVPVFIDNAESVNEVYKVDTQLIKLYVTLDEKLVKEDES